MKLFRVALGLLPFAILSAAGPLRRDDDYRPLHRRFENTTKSATSADPNRITIIPMSKSVSFITEKSTTVATTLLIEITGRPTSSLASPTSSTPTSSSSSSSSGSSSSSSSSSSSTSTSSSGSSTSIASGSSSTSSSSLGSLSSSNSMSSASLGSSGSLTSASTGLNVSIQTAVSGSGLIPSSSPSTSTSREFPLLTDTTTIAIPTGTSSIVSPITDTFTASSPTGISQMSTVVTIAMPTSTSSTSSSTIGVTTSLGTTVTTSSTTSPTSLLSVSALSVSEVPTVISSIPPTSSIGVSTFAQNVAMAKGYNALFSSLTASSSCTPGSIACVSGSTGNCDATGTFKITACGAGDSCFAVPMNTTAGVYVGCFNIITADSILGINNANTVLVSATSSITSVPNIISQTSQTTPASATQTFNNLSVTLPTASPGVIITMTSQAPAGAPTTTTSPDVIVTLTSQAPAVAQTTSIPSLSTTTVQVHQTSTMVIYLTPSSAAASFAPQTTSPAAPLAATKTGSGSLITIIPIPASDRVTITVTATVTERIKE